MPVVVRPLDDVPGGEGMSSRLDGGSVAEVPAPPALERMLMGRPEVGP